MRQSHCTLIMIALLASFAGDDFAKQSNTCGAIELILAAVLMACFFWECSEEERERRFW